MFNKQDNLRISQMRDKVREAYPAPSWKARVDKMPPNQIYAIYYALRDRDARRKKLKIKKEKPQYVQMTLWDIGFGKGNHEI